MADATTDTTAGASAALVDVGEVPGWAAGLELAGGPEPVGDSSWCWRTEDNRRRQMLLDEFAAVVAELVPSWMERGHALEDVGRACVPTVRFCSLFGENGGMVEVQMVDVDGSTVEVVDCRGRGNEHRQRVSLEGLPVGVAAERVAAVMR